MKKQKQKQTISGIDLIEHDLLTAYKYYDRLEPNATLDEKIKKSIESIKHYILSDLSQAAINIKNKITKCIWEL